MNLKTENKEEGREGMVRRKFFRGSIAGRTGEKGENEERTGGGGLYASEREQGKRRAG